MKFFQIIKPNVRYDFVGYKTLFGGFSLLAVIASYFLISFYGLNFGIDFSGGTEIQLAFNVCETGKKSSKSDKVSALLNPIKNARAEGKKKSSTRPSTQKVSKAKSPSNCIPREKLDINKLRTLLSKLYPKSTPVIQPMGTEGKEFVLKFKEISFLSQSKIKQIQKEIAKAYPNPKLPTKTELVNFRFRGESGDKIDLVFYHPLKGLTRKESEKKGATTKLAKELDAKKLEQILKKAGLQDVKISYSGHSGEGYEYTVSFAGLAGELLKKLGSIFGADNIKILQVESVGPRVGKKLRNDGIISILLANLFILIYIAIRFDFRYAPGAVVALIHDVSIITGVFSALQLPFDLTTIAALLTIVGYSLNDTIVVYDRIRENWQKSRVNFPEVINRSINETLSRTLLTSLTTLIAILPIYIIGGINIKWFAFAMILGILVGTYSSIGIASPIVLWLDNYFRRQERAADAEKEAKRERRRRRRAGIE